MSLYFDSYRDIFGKLGYSLTTSDGCDEAEIVDAEVKLGRQFPGSLREYYLAAGREKRFNHTYNRLVEPSNCQITNERLVFMVENQRVVFWGVDTEIHAIQDSPVYQGINRSPLTWGVEHASCFEFLSVMIHWQATYGGAMPYRGMVDVDQHSTRELLDRRFEIVGEDNGMRAYNTDGCALCFLNWKTGRNVEATSWRIFAGATSQTKLDEIKDIVRGDWRLWGT